MASSISILSLFVLVLISGYFTFPLDNFSSESSPLSFENELTTEHSFNARAAVGDDFFTTPSEESTSSVTEPFSLEYTTITTDVKRSVGDGSDIFATTVEYEFTTDAERRERMTEDFSTVESSTFTDITEKTPEEKREMEPASDIVEEGTTERVESAGNSRRGLDVELPFGKEPKETQSSLEFTTFATTLFASTSSDIAPEFYTHTSTEFSPMELTTQKYVGSLRKGDDDEEHESDRKQKPQEKADEELKPEKEEVHKPEEEEEGRKPEKEHKRKPNKEERKPEKEEEEKHKSEEHETAVDSDKEKDSKKKLSKSDKNDSSESDENGKEKYATGQLLDQDSSKSFQQRPKDFAILVEPDVFFTSMTNEVAKNQRFTTESTKLAQGSTLLLFLLAGFLFCACLTASTLAFVKNRHKLNRKSRIIEMEAYLDEHYTHPFLFHQHYEK
ncbi:unnamed protein product [Adineta ricciae]|uniref:Uncharacterized protein n=1 Tax=Adineta ricciae TaxID=249248 RepID=A0A814LHQ8_ADIRI|nr:unnamed protein product [Adineta ricciae]CAF1275016.1 unnamed protein product [Adineta ricciae]